jgi:AcrR family transcriptional regulator
MALTRSDWITVAVAALQSGGPRSVAVLPLATQLGATRGSFYWHFTDRAQLLEAALRHWEQATVDDIIEAVDAVPDPAQRLRALLRAGFASRPTATLEVVLAADNADSQVRPVLARVVHRRMAYLTDCFLALGITADEARRRAATAYCAYLGWMQLSAITPGEVAGADVEAVLDRLLVP